jgi:hypothetical protein
MVPARTATCSDLGIACQIFARQRPHDTASTADPGQRAPDTQSTPVSRRSKVGVARRYRLIFPPPHDRREVNKRLAHTAPSSADPAPALSRGLRRPTQLRRGRRQITISPERDRTLTL